MVNPIDAEIAGVALEERLPGLARRVRHFERVPRLDLPTYGVESGRLTRVDKDAASAFVKGRVGQRTSSHGGRYVDRRKGLRDEIPHLRLIRGVILVRAKDAAKVVALLEAMGADGHRRPVWLTPGDRRALSV